MPPTSSSRRRSTRKARCSATSSRSLEANGIKTQDRIALGATPVVRKAITAGEIDIYPEYTGNAGFFFNKADDAAWKNIDQWL